MMKLPLMLMIGSAGRNVGKTEFACSVIREFCSGRDMVGLKVTTVSQKDGTCPRGGKGCGVCSSLEGEYSITEETGEEAGKDTSRLLAAGADRVYWLRVMRTDLLEGLMAVLDIVGRETVIVCESNSLRTVVVPGLFVMMKDKASDQVKASAEKVKHLTDRVILFDGAPFDLGDFELTVGGWALRENATAIVLAGGESNRVKQDKSLLHVKGCPMIQHICRQLMGNFAEVLVSANDREKYAFLGLKVVPDRIRGMGPLMGVASALEASVSDLNLVVACDMPEIDIVLARRMLGEAVNVDCVVPRSDGGFLDPLFAVYRRGVLPEMDELLSKGERRMRSLFDRCSVRYLDLPAGNSLRNINTMDEYNAYISEAGPED